MNTLLENLIETVRGIWRFRWIALSVAWTVCLLGWAFVMWLPNTYLASARVFVDTRTTLSQVTKGLAVESDVESQLQRVRQALWSAPLLERVARETGLDSGYRAAQDRQSVITALRSRIDLAINAQDGVSGTYVITYTDTVRERAQAVVDRLLNAFVDNTIGGKKQSSREAQRFLVEQIGDYERRLAMAEERLARFKREHVGMMPGAQGDYFARLQAQMQELDKGRLELAVYQRRRDALERKLQEEQPVVPAGMRGRTVGADAAGVSGAPQSTGPGTMSSEAGATAPAGADSMPGAGAPVEPAQTASAVTAPALEAPVLPGAEDAGALSPGMDTASRIRETEARLEDLLLRFTDEYPDVVSLRETLAQLRERQKQEIEDVRRGDPVAEAGLGLSANPVYQSLRLQLNRTDVEIAAVRGFIADREAQIADLRKLVDTAPEVEAQFARLNRDYDVTRSSYQALVERLERARLGDEAEQTGVVRFEVVDPPSADFKPIAPRRSLLIVFVLAVGLGAGIGVAYLLHQVNPVFANTRQLARITGLPVLGSVSMTWLEKQRALARKRLFAFAGSGAMLFVTGILVLMVQSQVVTLVHDWHL
jgi:uncharacterized protein involved in exopolysaccharide biosynthesis